MSKNKSVKYLRLEKVSGFLEWTTRHVLLHIFFYFRHLHEMLSFVTQSCYFRRNKCLITNRIRTDFIFLPVDIFQVPQAFYGVTLVNAQPITSHALCWLWHQHKEPAKTTEKIVVKNLGSSLFLYQLSYNVVFFSTLTGLEPATYKLTVYWEQTHIRTTKDCYYL